MDHHADPTRSQPEDACGMRVVHRLHHLHLQEVVARAEAAHLPDAALDRARAHLPRRGAAHRPLVLAALEVPPHPMTLLHGVPGATQQDALELGPVPQPPDAARSRTARGLPAEGVHDPRQARPEIVEGQVRRGQQPDATGDVEADAAGRDDPSGAHVGGGHAADREPVAPVHVRHRVGGLHDARQGRDVGDLLQRVVTGVAGQQLPGREDDPRDPHRALALDAVAPGRLLDQPHRRLLPTATLAPPVTPG